MPARIAAIILAAGRSSRFDEDGTGTKVMAPLDGVPLVRAVALAALRSRAAAVTVVTGHEHERVVSALGGLAVRVVHNAGFATGLAGSLRVGLAATADEIDGALVMLADMPLVRTATLERLIARFEERPATIHAVVPLFDGKRGNPVLIGRRLFAAARRLSGDEGARRFLADPALDICLCDVDDPGIAIDIDTVADLEAVSGGRAMHERRR